MNSAPIELSLSLIIPAHNEQECIGALLTELSRLFEQLVSVEIIVVCNGCTDNSVAFIQEQYPNVCVVETSVASKVHALNLGDDKANYFPRVYLDADIYIRAEDLVTLGSELNISSQMAASPRIRFNTDNASFMVKQYYKAAYWSDYNQFDLLSNVIALSKQGHIRLGKFPQVMADDEYLRCLFSNNEKFLSKVSTYTFYTPRNLGGLLKILSRARLGNLKLEFVLNKSAKATRSEGSKGKGNQYLRMIKQAGLLSFVVFLFSKGISYIRSTYQYRRDINVWERDDSSRKR